MQPVKQQSAMEKPEPNRPHARPNWVWPNTYYPESAMIILRYTIGLLIFSLLSVGLCSTTNDLASLDQATRDAAAKAARDSWVPPSRTNWDSLLAALTNGTPRTNVLELLRPLQATPEGGGGSGTVAFQRYRLDDLWVLECRYHEKGNDPLFSRTLLEQVRGVWILPPTNFSGIWTSYWINGQRENEIYCTNGRYQGTFTGFNSDGEKAYVQHFENGRLEGEDTGYFRSGRINYRGLYRDDKHVGIWVWFNEDGSTNSVRDYSKP